MATRTVKITDGPDKPTLQRVLTMPDKLTAHFDVDGGCFELEGRIVSGVMKGAAFRAMYHIEGRSGSMEVAPVT